MPLWVPILVAASTGAYLEAFEKLFFYLEIENPFSKWQSLTLSFILAIFSSFVAIKLKIFQPKSIAKNVIELKKESEINKIKVDENQEKNNRFLENMAETQKSLAKMMEQFIFLNHPISTPYSLNSSQRENVREMEKISSVIYDGGGSLSVEDEIKLGEFSKLSGDYEASEKHYSRALSGAVSTNNKLLESDALKGLGNVALRLSDFDLAEKYYGKSLAVAESIGSDLIIGRINSNCGLLNRRRKRYSLADEYFQKSLQIRRKIGDESGVANVFRNLGVLAKEQSDYVTARQYYDKSLNLYTGLRDQRGQSYVYSNLSFLKLELGNSKEAKIYAEKSLEIKERLSDKRGKAYSLEAIGRAYMLEKNITDAASNLIQSLRLRQEIGDRYGESRSHLYLSKFYKQQSMIVQGDEHEKEYSRIIADIGVPIISHDFITLGE